MAGNRMEAERIAGYAAHLGISAGTLANMADTLWPEFCAHAGAKYANVETVGMAVDILQAVEDAALLTVGDLKGGGEHGSATAR